MTTPAISPTWAFDDTIRNQVDDVFAQWSTTITPGMTLGIYRHGEPAYLQAYGMANLEHDIPLTPGSIFHVASISKQFTDFCIALLADEGALDVEDDIRQHLPDVPDFGPTITIRHLIHHSSGLRDQWQLLHLAGWREEDLVTDSDVLDLVRRQRALNFPPNDEYLYSNTGYTLLSLIVKRVSGQSLREFAHERIFVPLEMTSTHFHDDHSEIVRGRTQAYQPRKEDGYRISIPEFDVVGTTSLFTTVEDMAKWERNLLTGEVGGPDLVARIQTPGAFNDGSPMEYAWGFRVERWRGAHRIGHAGADHGYRADFMRLPDHGFAVAVLSNVSDSAPGLLTEQVASIVLGNVLADEPEASGEVVPERSVSAADLAGTWYDATSGLAMFVAERDGDAWLDGDDPLPLTVTATGALANPARRLTITPGPNPNQAEVSVAGTSRSFTMVNAPTPAPDDLRQLLGAYWSEELAVPYEVVMHNDTTIAIRRRKFDDRVFRPVTDDLFGNGSLDGGATVAFQRDDSGAVTGFRLTAGRIRNLAFTRQHT